MSVLSQLICELKSKRNKFVVRLKCFKMDLFGMKNKLVWKKIRIANKITFLLGLFHRCCHSLMVGGRDFFNYSLVHIILPVFTLVIIERKGWDVDFIRVALHDHDVILFLFCRLVMKALFCVRQKCFSSFSNILSLSWILPLSNLLFMSD